MSKYKHLLWDIDGTVLDFKAAEAAVKKLFGIYGLGDCSDAMVERYSAINIKYWHLLEQKKMSKPEILIARFHEFFASEGIKFDKIEEFNSVYQTELGDAIVFNDDSPSLLKQLKPNFTLIAITNGTAIAQRKKLTSSGLDKIFDYIFISGSIGAEKPDKKFFDISLKQADIRDLNKTLIISDSLTSDIAGGKLTGIDTCWYNPQGKADTKNVSPEYTIRNLREILNIVL